jgi:CheY-like chemotaxis protein
MMRTLIADDDPVAGVTRIVPQDGHGPTRRGLSVKPQTIGMLMTRLKNMLGGAHESGPLKEKQPLAVLVVDDEEQVRIYLDRVLRAAGYRTFIAKNGIEAAEATLNEGPFDVLLTDLVMPQIGGEELARRLRMTQPDLPVLYLTGFSDRLFMDRQLLGEHEAFLDKPCTPTGLIEAVSLVSGTPCPLRAQPS